VFAPVAIITTVFFSCSFVHAQVPAVLLEACNSIADADKRLECLKAAAGKPAAAAPSYEALSRAFTGIQSGLGVGVSYNNYQAALLDLAKELGVYERIAPPEAGAALADFRKALETYKDAGTFWNASIEFFAHRNNRSFLALPVDAAGVGWVVSKYQVPTRNADILGLSVGVETDLALAKMWRDAAAQAAAGLRLLGDPAAIAAAAAAQSAPTVSRTQARTGIVVTNLTADMVVTSGVRRGVKVASSGGAGARANIQQGDIIVAVGNTEIGTVEEFDAVVAGISETKPIPVLLRRGKLATYVVIRP